MEYVFLLNSCTQPRCHKRIRSFIDLGYTVKVYSFDRNWYSLNRPVDFDIEILADISYGSYIKRLLIYFKKLSPIFKKHGKKCTYYCFGMDLALVTMLFKRKYIYEESDLMYLEYNKIAIPFFRCFDKFIQKKSVASVLTSNGFLDYLYSSVPTNIFVIPNKLDSNFLKQKRPNVKRHDLNKIRFAFIGLLRYPNTIFPFIEVMGKFNSNYEFHIWGDGPQGMKDLINQCIQENNNVYYHGPFRNPSDLFSIYDRIDINFVCYDTHGLNERVAEPNKLYESIYFNTPIIVSENTYLAKQVEKINNGFVLDCSSTDAIYHFFANLSNENLNIKSNNAFSIPLNEIVDIGTQIKSLTEFVENDISIENVQ